MRTIRPSGGRLVPLRTWWDKLHDRGPDFGYFLNPAKSVLVVKPDDYHEAVQLFDGTGIRITATGNHYLDSAIGTPAFVEDYVHEKARDWCGQVESLTSTALPQPQAAYSAFTRGLSSRWSFLCQVLEGASAGLASLERVIATKLLPALTGQEISSELRTLFSFPCRNGGLGILDPTSLPAQYQSSRAITAPMVANILTQSFNLGDSLAEVASLKASNGKDVKEAATEALRQFTARASLPTSTPSTLAVRHVRPADSRVAPSVGMGSACRSVNFAMVWHCGMVAGCQPHRTRRYIQTGLILGGRRPVAEKLAAEGLEMRFYFYAVRHLLQLASDDVPYLIVAKRRETTSGARESMLNREGGTTDTSKMAASGVWGGRFERVYLDVRVFNPFALQTALLLSLLATRAMSARSVAGMVIGCKKLSEPPSYLLYSQPQVELVELLPRFSSELLLCLQRNAESHTQW